MEVWFYLQNRSKLCNALFQLVKLWSSSFLGLCELLMCSQLSFMSCCLKSAGSPLLCPSGKLLSVAKAKTGTTYFLPTVGILHFFFQIICTCMPTVPINLPESACLAITFLFDCSCFHCETAINFSNRQHVNAASQR